MGKQTLKKVALDSNIFIYLFEENPKFIDKTSLIFNKLEQNKLEASTSIISLIESLSFPSPPNVLEEIEKGFKTIPNLSIYEVNESISITAARIRRDYKFRLPDSIHLSSAIFSKAQTFITNDQRLKNFKELRITMIENLHL